ncbi:MAG: hypothetical protein J6Y07_01680 [Alphaproteobacteria bacterium]|nr:hypothetical protein [Alphaproteobacteria bacterium]
MEKIAHEYARTFSNASGKAVISHLRKITIERFLGPHATDSELRSLEGARALVHQIETLIERGQANAKV